MNQEFKVTGAYSFRSTPSNKNTLFSSIASLLEHCETLFELKIRNGTVKLFFLTGTAKVPTRTSSQSSPIYNSKHEIQVKTDEKLAQELARKEFEEFNKEKSVVKSHTSSSSVTVEMLTLGTLCKFYILTLKERRKLYHIMFQIEGLSLLVLFSFTILTL